jgi:predicted transcriptional regulator
MQGPHKSVVRVTAIHIELQAKALTALDNNHQFDSCGDMEVTDVLAALAALAQETRLDIFRLLVQAGTGGLAAGQIADRLGLPSATLAFHLKELKNAGLIA